MTIRFKLMKMVFIVLVLSIGLSLSVCYLSKDTEKETVSLFIEKYFGSWSDQNMDAYKKCFHLDATIYFLDSTGNPHASLLDPFIQSQVRAHAHSPTKMSEIPTHKHIELYGQIAKATVRWQLFKENEERTGTDFFMLIKTTEGWKILTLVFINDP